MSDSDEPAERTAQWASPPASPAKLGQQIRPAILSVLVLTLLTGCAFCHTAFLTAFATDPDLRKVGTVPAFAGRQAAGTRESRMSSFALAWILRLPTYGA